MLEWVLDKTWGFGWRTAVTLGCVLTIRQVMALSGIRLDLNPLLVAAVLTILATRVWARWP